MGICINEALLVLFWVCWFFFPTLLVEPLGCPGLLGLFVKFLLILSYSVVLMFTFATMRI